MLFDMLSGISSWTMTSCTPFRFYSFIPSPILYIKINSTIYTLAETRGCCQILIVRHFQLIPDWFLKLPPRNMNRNVPVVSQTHAVACPQEPLLTFEHPWISFSVDIHNVYCDSAADLNASWAIWMDKCWWGCHMSNLTTRSSVYRKTFHSLNNGTDTGSAAGWWFEPSHHVAIGQWKVDLVLFTLCSSSDPTPMRCCCAFQTCCDVRAPWLVE